MKARSAWTKAVETFGMGNPTAVVSPPMIVPGANGADGKIAVILPLPPPSAAGFVHSTSSPARLLGPTPRARDGRPKREGSGGVALNVEKATTQPT